ncbi:MULTISPECIES: DEAD/DEAH box helicase [Yersiniaceae]|jgi:predicted helicase|uniref:DEAD/DEAH box helicase n=3 Tax=Yersiniaceae TaxID=1903411 RepID=A0AAD2Z7K2_YEREN|nr:MULTISPECIES: type ISP restriction/modification enzyme [Yersinia]EKN6050278.1 damage-inducible protein [Yersinia enterocolitica]MDN6017892.1 DEAD/DEAH box helicase family protein [Enterobacterales bacterium]ELI8104288.1 DEAD/DEAH box helicase [Yersinia enterocolitica]MDN6113553.1 DEAD/DEAH box helicase family protein [Enterobacterales bacterium]MDN6650590.1 DEAD/DEAH box helicase family protein [Enterobacterales bacterium]
MNALSELLSKIENASPTQRDKGTTFENLCVQFFLHEPKYAELYSDVLSYAGWIAKYGEAVGITTKKDAGIDLVAITKTGEFHAIQCKNYNQTKIAKKDIDSFLAASDKTYFTLRYIVASTDNWTEEAKDMLRDKAVPVTALSLTDLEQSALDWSQFDFDLAYKPVMKAKKQLRPHQTPALDAVKRGLATADRGKLIMACGTGKTFTSLRIAEAVAGCGKTVLFLVPSLALLSQTLDEWTQDTLIDLRCFAVCSDSDVGKKNHDDNVVVGISDLKYPATTNANSLVKAFNQPDIFGSDKPPYMNVVFSTYHSVEVIHQAQKLGFPAFDFIICDEAHRTTGATFDGDDESAFVRIHDNAYIAGHKRLYMTATPRIFGDDAKETEGVTLCSMDDKRLYGDDLYVITFSKAVQLGILCDYKVIVLAVEEKHVSRRIQSLLKDENNQLKVDDAAKIVGCWKALAKQGLADSDGVHPDAMKRAVAFCQVIEESKGKVHKVSSKLITEMFGAVVEAYQASEIELLRETAPDKAIDPSLKLQCQVKHVDGSMNATEKKSKIEWLKADADENVCRILSNVRCLSEGVDVPSLDAVLFLTPRSSQVDVVQSVGRVMRRAEGKELGYVILPVVIPAGEEPENALNNNQAYRVVWQVLNALRAHDDRFDAMINKLEFNGKDTGRMEVIAVADKVVKKTKRQTKKSELAGKARKSSGIGSAVSATPEQFDIEFSVGEIERALYAKIVKKCGNRHHWEDWANDIAKIARTHIDRIRGILENPGNKLEISAFRGFADELRDDLNNSVSDDEIIEMLAQHLITKPVFDALFADYNFTDHNPMSMAMQNVLNTLQEHHLEKEASTLNSFYESVKMRADGITTAEGKQQIIVQLYDKFFRNAFPRMTERLGIVYTPVEVVDFIIHSVNDVLKQEFGQTLADKGVHILDPFTGTGTFITRLLQSGLIPSDKLAYKFKHEIHANEIVLLAYYIAAINIEAVYHGITDESEYTPFEGICLTDTFEMYEKDDLVSAVLVDNSERRKRQKALDIRVIIGNPPYSSADKDDNNNKNVSYPSLDKRISETYIFNSSKSSGKSKLYDSYIRAIRWASDRIGNKGVIGFVTNGGYIDTNSADGLRKCLTDEFSSLYFFHLRGNQRTSGEKSRQEGGKIFGSGSRSPIVIAILVKNPAATQTGNIYFHDIGDYLTREEKLEKISEFVSINGIAKAHGWQSITPDAYNDWLNQRDDSFGDFISIGRKEKDTSLAIFGIYSMGVKTNRDDWVYNYSIRTVNDNVDVMIDTFNSEIDRLPECVGSISDWVIRDKSKIKWTSDILNILGKKNKQYKEGECFTVGLYRPFSKEWFYSNKTWNWSRHLVPRFIPEKGAHNLIIGLTGVGETKGFTCLITNISPNLHFIAGSQCFPLYIYDEDPNYHEGDGFLLGETGGKYIKRDAITDDGFCYFKDKYKNSRIEKEDVFYYVYGLLHSDEYRSSYADNLSKELPRIPCVKSVEDFFEYSKAGRNLADLHLNYETIEPYKATIDTGSLSYSQLGKDDFYVEKMKFAKKGEKGTVIYNNKIRIKNIPIEAYDYIVNGKSALEWVMEQQSVSTNNDSGIVNDANDWAIETMDNPRYPLELFLRIITVSLETQKIVNNLPKLDI